MSAARESLSASRVYLNQVVLLPTVGRERQLAETALDLLSYVEHLQKSLERLSVACDAVFPDVEVSGLRSAEQFREWVDALSEAAQIVTAARG